MFENLNLGDEPELAKALHLLIDDKDIQRKTNLTINQIKIICKLKYLRRLELGDTPTQALEKTTEDVLNLMLSFEGKSSIALVEAIKGLKPTLTKIPENQAIAEHRAEDYG